MLMESRGTSLKWLFRVPAQGRKNGKSRQARHCDDAVHPPRPSGRVWRRRRPPQVGR